MVNLLSVLIFAAVICATASDLVVKDAKLNKRWESASRTFDSVVFSHRPKAIEILDKSIKENARLGLTSGCVDALKALKSGLERRTFWSYKCKKNYGFIHSTILTTTHF